MTVIKTCKNLCLTQQHTVMGTRTHTQNSTHTHTCTYTQMHGLVRTLEVSFFLQRRASSVYPSGCLCLILCLSFPLSPSLLSAHTQKHSHTHSHTHTLIQMSPIFSPPPASTHPHLHPCTPSYPHINSDQHLAKYNNNKDIASCPFGRWPMHA